jgi:hypothetical protein
VLVTSVISTSVESSPISATSAGDAIIGEATACSISPRNRSGDALSNPVTTLPMPNSSGTMSALHTVAAITSIGRARYPRMAATSTRMNEITSRTNTASVTQGLSSAPSGGMAMPIKTSAAMARVPCRPSHASAATGSGNEVCGFAGMTSFGKRERKREKKRRADRR